MLNAVTHSSRQTLRVTDKAVLETNTHCLPGSQAKKKRRKIMKHKAKTFQRGLF